jgi:hypothetical protein
VAGCVPQGNAADRAVFRIELGNFEKVGSRFGHICGGEGMIPKSVKRFSDQIMPKLIPKSVKRFSDQIMPKLKKERRV